MKIKQLEIKICLEFRPAGVSWINLASMLRLGLKN